jgi:hypothetical protein
MKDYGVHNVVVVESKEGKLFPLGTLSCHDIALKAYPKTALTISPQATLLRGGPKFEEVVIMWKDTK